MMKKVVRSGLAIIAAGSIGLTLTACGSKGETTSTVSEINKAIAEESVNGAWIVLPQDGGGVNRMGILALDTNLKRATYLYPDSNQIIQCDDIKGAFSEIKSKGIFSTSNRTNYRTLDSEITKGNMVDLGGKLSFILGDNGLIVTSLDRDSSGYGQETTFLRPEQGEAKTLIAGICGEIPVWK